MSTNGRKPDYGIDAPYAVMAALAGGLAGVTIGVIVAIAIPSSPYWTIPLVWGMVGLGYALIFVLSSKLGKPWLRDRILESLDLKGDEQVLDVGCGKGLLLIGAAKKLSMGKAVGIDIWRGVDQSGHSPALTLENARRERVEDRVEVRNADARDIPFENSRFDVVLSGLVIHNIPRQERARALEEMVRVLKPGGKLAIFDIWGIGDYAKVLRRLGIEEARLSYTVPLFLSPTRLLTATKPVGSES
jgi:SAM-dependent methyltransferase